MNDAILIQHVYPAEDPSFVSMMELTRIRNEEYCRIWGLDFKAEQWTDPERPAKLGAWAKVKLLRDALRAGYQKIIWLDVDAMIWDLETDLRDGVIPGHLGACWHRIPQLDHWNVGVLFLDNCPEVAEFIDQWWSSYPPPGDGWFEQGVFNRLARQSRTVITLSDRWNATLDVNMVPDAVILGFHGQGPGARRLQLMTETLNRINPIPLGISQEISNGSNLQQI